MCEWSVAGTGQEEPRSSGWAEEEGRGLGNVNLEGWQIFLCGFMVKGEGYSSEHSPVPWGGDWSWLCVMGGTLSPSDASQKASLNCL